MACEQCGEATTKSFYKLCLDCWKSKQSITPVDTLAQENHQLKQCIIKLEKRVEFLDERVVHKDFIIALLNKSIEVSAPSGNNDLLRKARVLCHPDKHGGSALSKSVTQDINRILS